MTTDLVIGLASQAITWATITSADLPTSWLPDGVDDWVAFARVGAMQNFDHLGGLIGMLKASVHLISGAIRLSKGHHPGRESQPPAGSSQPSPD